MKEKNRGGILMARRSIAIHKNASELFTDRELPRFAFWDKLKKLEEEPGSSGVLAYYGEGGIGKSWLLNELYREVRLLKEYREEGKDLFDLIRKDPGIAFRGEYLPVYYNLESSVDIVEILCHLRAAVYRERPEFSFPVFDLAVKKYEDLTGTKVSPDLKDPENRSLSLFEKIFEAASVIPGIATVNEAYKQLKESLGAAGELLSLIRDPAVRQQIEAVERCETAEDLRRNIPVWFADDLSDDERDFALVFFIDTFELFQHMKDLKYNDERILRDTLPGEIDNALWVFAGRNRIFPGEEHDQLLIGDLSKEDAVLYLKEKQEIRDEKIIEKMWQITGGTPVWLDLCVSSYRSGGEPPAEEFTLSNKTELVKRYLQYQGTNERLILRAMSAVMHWKDGDFREVFEKAHAVSWALFAEAYGNICQTAMIETIGEERRFLHRSVRNAVYEDPDYPEENRRKTLDALLELYERRVREPGADELYYQERLLELLERINDDNEKLTEEQTGRIGEILSLITSSLRAHGTEYIERFLQPLEGLRERGQIAPEDKAARMLGFYYYLTNRNEEAYLLRKEIAAAMEKKYGREHIRTLLAQDDLRTSLIGFRRFKEALQIAEELLPGFRKQFGEKSGPVLKVKAETAHCFLETEKLKEAADLYEEVLADSRESRDPLLELNAMADLAEVCLQSGETKKAADLLLEAYEKSRMNYGDQHTLTLEYAADLARALFELGEEEEAYDLLSQTFKAQNEKFGLRDLQTGRTCRMLLRAARLTGRNEEVLELAGPALSTLEMLLKKENTETDLSSVEAFSFGMQSDGPAYEKAEILTAVGDSCTDLGRPEEAEEDYREALEIYENGFLLQPVLILQTAEKLAETMCRTKGPAAAADMLEGNYSFYKDVAGAESGMREFGELFLRLLRECGKEERAAAVEEDLRVLAEKRKARCMQDVRKLAQQSAGQYKEKDYAGSLKTDEKILELLRREFSENDPFVLDILGNICSDLSALGDHRKALQIAEELYVKRKEVFGKKDPNTKKALRIYAAEAAYAGDLEKAESLTDEYEGLYGEKLDLLARLRSLKFYKKASLLSGLKLEAERKRSGEDSDKTYILLVGHLTDLQFCGKYEEALRYADTAYERQSRHYGAESVAAARVLRGRAHLKELLKRYEEALQDNEQALQILKEQSGSKDPETLSCCGAIGYDLLRLHRYEEAAAYLEEYLNILKNDPETEPKVLISALLDLELAQDGCGRYEDLCGTCKELLYRQQELLGEEHIEIAKIRERYAFVLLKLDKFAEAKEQAGKALKLYRKFCGPKDAGALRASDLLSRALTSLEEFEDAAAVLEELLQAYAEVLKPENPLAVGAAQRLCYVRGCAGHHEDVIRLSRENLEKWTPLLGRSHPDVLRALDYLALACSAAGRTEEAIEADKEALAGCRESGRTSSPEMLKLRRRLVKTYERSGDLKNTGQYLEEILTFDRALLTVRETVELLGDFADVCGKTDRREEALRCRKEAYELQKQFAGEEYPDTLREMRRYAEELCRQHRFEEAYELDSALYALCRKKSRPDEELLSEVLDSLLHELKMLGRSEESGVYADELTKLKNYS
ncbi:MAG: tetratricopeptide repeat protein [Erysipelotrichaceae bacterium]|nr:tetratricopeptide repeat protein [Erysipelotrichaceae bacterium]